MWHVETDFFALAVFIVMLFKNKPSKTNRTFKERMFYNVLLLSIFNVVVDIISSVAMNDIKNWWAYQIIMTIYVLTIPLLSAVWVCYTAVIIGKDRPHSILKRNIALIMAPYWVYAILALSNPFTGLFFNLTEDIEYSRGILFLPVGVGLIMVYSLFGIVLVAANRKKVAQKSNTYLFLLFFVTTAVSIWIQLANPGWLIINACYAIICVWCDMTIEEQNRKLLYDEITKKNQELQAALKTAEAATKAKTMFLANMSHDMRTPMNAIIGLSNLAMDLNTEVELKDYMSKINLSGKQLLTLINDTLDVSRIENGKLTMNREYIMSYQLLQEGIASTRVVAEHKNVNFRVESDGFQNSLLYVDAIKITKLFTNLLSNAVKFTPPGGEIVFSIKKLGATDRVAHYCMSVRDTGIGMSKGFLNRIFEPFSQECADHLTNYSGTGLGMTIVKEFADFLGCKLEINSELGKGTEVKVWIDFQLADEGVRLPKKSEKTSIAKSHNLLIAEDHPLNAHIIRKLLEKEGYSVTIVENGKKCVSEFIHSEVNYYGLILMDIRMPEMDGMEATRVIRACERADAKTIPIFAMTANAFEQDVNDCKSAGMNGHLSKPIEPELLKSTLLQYLE